MGLAEALTVIVAEAEGVVDGEVREDNEARCEAEALGQPVLENDARGEGDDVSCTCPTDGSAVSSAPSFAANTSDDSVISGGTLHASVTGTWRVTTAPPRAAAATIAKVCVSTIPTRDTNATAKEAKASSAVRAHASSENVASFAYAGAVAVAVPAHRH